jgi:hypothetical protein
MNDINILSRDQSITLTDLMPGQVAGAAQRTESPNEVRKALEQNSKSRRSSAEGKGSATRTHLRTRAKPAHAVSPSLGQVLPPNIHHELAQQ